MQWYGDYGIEHSFIRRGWQLVTGAAVKVVLRPLACRRKGKEMIVNLPSFLEKIGRYEYTADRRNQAN